MAMNQRCGEIHDQGVRLVATPTSTDQQTVMRRRSDNIDNRGTLLRHSSWMVPLIIALGLATAATVVVEAWAPSTHIMSTGTTCFSFITTSDASRRRQHQQQQYEQYSISSRRHQQSPSLGSLLMTSSTDAAAAGAAAEPKEAEAASDAAAEDDLPFDYEVPEDAVITIKPRAMKRLRELKAMDPATKEGGGKLVLRMGVRSGGCSGMSYVMDFASLADIDDADDAVDEYTEDGIVCVVDTKSVLYLYGLELDYSEKLIGGGFLFNNPNAEESCGCGSSFGV